MPRHRPDRTPRALAVTSSEARASKKENLGIRRQNKILLVDDKADIRELLAIRLAMVRGMEVIGEAGNGAEAISLARQNQPDAVILDLEMPVMSGRQVTPILRAAVPGIRILVYSGFTEPDKELGGAVKPDAILPKGVDLGVLVEQLQRLLAETPADILRVSLGRIPLAHAISAFDSWVGLNARIRESAGVGSGMSGPQTAGATQDELLALTGIFLQLANPLLHASQAGLASVDLKLELRRDAGQAARRALASIEAGGFDDFLEAWDYKPKEEVRGALGLLRDRLLKELPAS